MNQTFSTLRRHWMPLLALNSVLLAATIYAGIYASIKFIPTWKANAQLNLPETTDKFDANLGTLGNVESTGIGFSKDVNPLQIQLTIITSDTVLERVRASDPEKNLYSSLGSYKALFEVTPQELSTIISIEAKGSSSDLAYKRVATLIKVYQQRLNELRHNHTGDRELFAQEELQKARNDLKQAQTALANFQQSTGVINITEQTTGLITAINDLKTTQARLIAEAQANETQTKVAAAGLGMTPQQAMNSLRLGENKEYQAIREKVSQVETTLAEARGRYRDESPVVQSLLLQRQELLLELNQRIAAAIPNATEAVDTTLGGSGSRDSRIEMIAELTRTQIAAKGQLQQAGQIQNQVSKLSAELNSISTNQSQLSDLQRRYEIAEGVYKGIIAQLQQAKTNPFNVYPNVQILDAPAIDPKPITLKRSLIAFGGILTAIFGSTALVLLLEARKPLLKPKDLQQVEFPVLVSISRLKRPNMERDLRAEVEIDFQRLASVISSLKLENNRLMLTSSTFGEGKTTVTLGLALALVNFGFRVLVVDADLQQAEMSRRLGYALTKNTDSKQTLIPVCPSLDLMPAPYIQRDKIAEFFARGTFERRLNVIQDSGCYDYVLVDSAPVGLTIEPALMSKVVRNVLFVVRPGTSDRYLVMDSVEQLTRHHAQIKGLVVNGVESGTERYSYGYQRQLVETEA